MAAAAVLDKNTLFRFAPGALIRSGTVSTSVEVDRACLKTLPQLPRSPRYRFAREVVTRL